ncbi:hypothetical protein GGI23_000907 [Coemansia sp. RSA 2559]|nr:hypothetical protein GGI23_000907 [Coemansia sp. RSA 2559]KAJ2868864.1 hypothetical protein GGI22_000599 [Coemansia erecta]
MGIERVPDDVMFLVLRNIACGRSYGLRGWKRKLGILGVCRRWRALAQRQAFDDIYVESYETGSRRLKTNIGLCAAAGSSITGSAKRKRLTLLIENGAGNLEAAITSVLTVLEPHARLINEVGELRIEFSGYPCLPPSNRGRQQQRRRSTLHTVLGIIDLGSQLARLASHATTLRFRLGKADRGATLFGHVVVRHFAKRLVHLDTNTAMSLPDPGGFQGRRLALHTNVEGVRLHVQPRIEPRLLESLHLSWIDYRFDWRVFLCKADSESLVDFAQLRELVVEPSTASVRGPSNMLPGYLTSVKIRAPVLQRVCAEATPLSCLLLWTLRMPQTLESVWLDCADGATLVLRNVDSPRLQAAVHKYAMRRMGAAVGGIELANDVLGGAGCRVAGHSSLLILGAVAVACGGDDGLLGIRRWTHLDSLEIRSRVSWLALREILVRAPHLAELKAHCVVDVPPGAGVDAEWHAVQGTRIRRAWIRLG